jgi:carboxylesterase type B
MSEDCLAEPVDSDAGRQPQAAGDGLAARRKAPSWLYRFAWEDEVRKAFHTIEIPRGSMA